MYIGTIMIREKITQNVYVYCNSGGFKIKNH